MVSAMIFPCEASVGCKDFRPEQARELGGFYAKPKSNFSLKTRCLAQNICCFLHKLFIYKQL
jgi:hypothetical protein